MYIGEKNRKKKASVQDSKVQEHLKQWKVPLQSLVSTDITSDFTNSHSKEWAWRKTSFNGDTEASHSVHYF